MISPEQKEVFITELQDTGKVNLAARKAKISTVQLYRLRKKNKEFAEHWDTALSIWMEEIDASLLLTAKELGLGKWVPKIDQYTGEHIIGDNYEKVYEFNVDNVDPRVLIKLLALRMPSEKNQVNIQVNNQADEVAANKPPALVFP